MMTSKREMLARGALLLSCLAMGVAYSGCAQDVGTIDRTRPDKLKKSIFSGDDEWYYLQTVVSTDFQASNGFGAASQVPLKRIRWTITEDTLFAYSTTEPAVGIAKGLQDSKDRRLGVVAAFPIIKHFDVQRGYNSSTGQLSNVVEENSSDRLWYDREYMRVDWGSNRIDGVGLITNALGRYSSVNRTVPEGDSASDYDRTRISNDYIDVVTEYYFQPDLYSCASRFSFDTWANCEAGPIKIRNSFKRIKKKKTYEPVPYFDYEELRGSDGKSIKVGHYSAQAVACTPEVKQALYLQQGELTDQDVCTETAKFDLFKRFGYFRTEQPVYSAGRGTRYIAGKRYYANTFNIWQTAYDDEGNLLPLEERKPKQIVYYLNVAFPDDGDDGPYTRGWKKLQEAWNKVFMNTVKLAHNIVDLDEVGGYYNWASALVSELGKIDQEQLADDGPPSEESLQTRLGLKNSEAVPGSPLFYALKRIEYLYNHAGLDNFCESYIATALELEELSCKASADPEDLKNKVITKLESKISDYQQNYSASEKSSLSRAPFVVAVLELVRAYFDTPQQVTIPGKLQYETPKVKLAEVEKYWRGVRNSFKGESADFKKKARERIPNVTFQTGKEDRLKKLVRDNNRFDPSGNPNTDDEASHMFLIKENSCSPKMLMKWKENYGDVNEEVQALFSGKTRDSLRKLPLEDLQKFCAKLEWATRDFARDDSAQKDPRHFDWQRQGDLNYSFITWVPENVFWLGYGPMASDPQTGEVIAAAANFAGGSIESYVSRAADIQMLFDGRLTEENLITGDYVADEFEKEGLTPELFLRKPEESSAASVLQEQPSANVQFLGGVSSPVLRTRGGITAKSEFSLDTNSLSSSDIEKLAGFSRLLEPKVQKLLSPQAQAFDYERFLKVQDEKLKQLAKVSQDPAVIAARLTSPGYAAMLDMLGKARFGDRELTQDERDSIIAELAAPALAVRRKEAEQRKSALQNVYPLEALEHALNATVTEKASVEFLRNKPRKEIEDYFREGVFFGTQVHEVGHTLGLRHNFIGSYDALNYPRQYWDVEAAEAENNPVLASAGYKKDIGYLSKENLDKISPEGAAGTTGFFDRGAYRSSSVMDYTAGFTSGFTGVGPYDEAAIQFVYAKRLQVFDEPVRLTSFKRTAINLSLVNYDELPVLFMPDNELLNERAGVYNGVVDVLGANKELPGSSLQTLWETRAQLLRPDAVRRMTHGRRWITVDEAKRRMVDGLEQRSRILADALKQVPPGGFDGKFLDERPFKVPVAAQFYWSDSLSFVPYRFCTDSFQGLQAGCNKFDWGATPEEILQYRIDTFENYKNRLRYAHGTSSMAFQNFGAYYGAFSQLLYSVQQPFYRYVNLVLANKLDLWSYTDSLKRASVTGLNFIAQIYAQPEPGKYCPQNSKDPLNPNPKATDVDRYVPYADRACDEDKQLLIDRDNGVKFDYRIGPTYNTQLSRLPGYVDRELAVGYMFLVSGNYVGKNLNNDVLSDRGSFWTAYNDQVYNFLKGVVLNKPEYFAGKVDTSSGKPKYLPPVLLEKKVLEAYENNVVPEEESSKPYVRVPATFNDGYRALLYGLVLNNTAFDEQGDLIQYVKVCASNDECDRDYTDIDESFNGTIPPGEVGAGTYKNGRKLVSYEVKDPDDPNVIIASLTDVPSTTYRTSTGIIVKTFIHPELPVIYRVPIARNGKSITGEIIDTLNDWVYGEKEPSYADIVNRNSKVLLAGWYFKDKKALQDIIAKGPGTEGFKDKRDEFDSTRSQMEYYISKLDVIRDIMERTGGLY